MLSFWSFTAKGQSSAMLLNYSKEDVSVGGAIAKNPGTLARRLTEGKSSEKEKFDAIFAWVSTNIRYDFASYFSSGGSGMPRVKMILKYRSGICIDYAHLMDTLCNLSGITNVSVYGYAKDEIFDVNDSLYLDNHAWNAVKLDGLWYLYDVTWASGQPEYRFTKFSNFIYKLYLRHAPKYKVKKIIDRKNVFISYCDDAIQLSAPDTITYYKQRFWNRVFLARLQQFKPKVKRYSVQKLDTAFYLCNPETFAVTHFPDDPAWSLVSQRTVRGFEGDSAYYHFHDSLYKTQQRFGRPCGACDGFLGQDELNKNINLRKESLNFNRRNRFVTMHCEYNIGKLKLLESRNFDDSLSKVTVIDTALAWHDKAKTSLYQSFLNIEQDYYLQSNKNHVKANLLYDENNAYVSFLLGEKFSIKVQSKSVKNLERRTRLMERKLDRRHRQFRYHEAHEIPNKKLVTTAAKLLELHQKMAYADSLITLYNQRIDSLKNVFGEKVKVLSIGLKEKTLEHDSVFSLFKTTMKMRYYMRDNYKKDVVELRKKIEGSKSNYMNDIEAKVYQPAKECIEIGDRLFNSLLERNACEAGAFKVRAELVRRSKLEPDELKAYKDLLKRRNGQDLCWFEKNTPKFKALFFMFEQFSNRQWAGIRIVKRENSIEAMRERYVNKELGRRKRKYKKIILHNTKAVNYELRMTRKEKRDFLKKLRNERREAARNSK